MSGFKTGLLIFAVALSTSAQNAQAAKACEGIFAMRPTSKLEETNPIFALPKAPSDQPINYPVISAKVIDEAMPEAIRLAKERIQAIKAVPNPTFNNTIKALADASEELDMASSLLGNFESMVATPEIEALVEKWTPALSEFSTSLIFDPEIFQRIKTIYEKRDRLRLSREHATVLENSYLAFVKNGANLSSADKKRVEEINARLSDLSTLYAKNDREADAKNFVVVTDVKRLAGLPEDVVAAAKKLATTKGQPENWVLSIYASTYGQVLSRATDRTLREEMWRTVSATGSQAGMDNRPVAIEIARLRREKARILGFDSHAHLVTQDRMAKTPETVLAFIAKLREKYLPAAREDARELQAFATSINGPADLQVWDLTFYAEKLKEARYAFDGEQVRPYLPLESVLKGAFGAAEKLYGIRFSPLKDVSAWHPSVMVFRLDDKKSGKFLGFFYLDPYEREGKQSGAWSTSTIGSGEWLSGLKRPHVINVLNLAPPLDGRPSLLTMNDVRTVFHELGHGLHALLSTVRMREIAGTSVPRDFVELPSQLFEEWAMDPGTLQSFARHYKTGEIMPLEMIEKIRRADNFRVASAGLRQLSLGALDMAWHTGDLSQVQHPEDIVKFEKEAVDSFRIYPATGAITSTTFGHIFAGGYSAGYYSYKWADSLVADAFELFKANGLFDQKTARRYRREILSKGGSQNPAILYRNFRGQEPDPDALLRREGLIP